jgi:hypothetical protein
MAMKTLRTAGALSSVGAAQPTGLSQLIEPNPEINYYYVLIQVAAQVALMGGAAARLTGVARCR